MRPPLSFRRAPSELQLRAAGARQRLIPSFDLDLLQVFNVATKALQEKGRSAVLVSLDPNYVSTLFVCCVTKHEEPLLNWPFVHRWLDAYDPSCAAHPPLSGLTDPEGPGARGERWKSDLRAQRPTICDHCSPLLFRASRFGLSCSTAASSTVSITQRAFLYHFSDVLLHGFHGSNANQTPILGRAGKRN